jgi:hypothetical protein
MELVAFFDATNGTFVPAPEYNLPFDIQLTHYCSLSTSISNYAQANPQPNAGNKWYNYYLR